MCSHLSVDVLENKIYDSRFPQREINRHLQNIRLLIYVITGYCMIGHIFERMRYLGYNFCRKKYEEKSVNHLLCDSPTLKRIGRCSLHNINYKSNK